jgi:hypothetical protein
MELGKVNLEGYNISRLLYKLDSGIDGEKRNKLVKNRCPTMLYGPLYWISKNAIWKTTNL